MLQIATGKLFSKPPGQRNELRGIAYTNLQLYGRKPIVTSAGRLLPSDSIRGNNGVIYEITELIEEPPNVGIVASHGIDPYLDDFAAIVSFALDVTCSPDADVVSRLTSGRRGPGFYCPPGKLIRRAFDNRVLGRDEDGLELVKFVDDLIGLRRKMYLGAIRAIRTFVTGLHRVADNLEVAYTLLVISIESLAQNFGGDKVKWEDYDERKRDAIDSALNDADCATAMRVRNTLLELEHVSLKRRFRDFTLEHLQPSFFREEANAVDGPIGRSELPVALNQTYDLRSRFIHNLGELPHRLTMGDSYSETERIGGVVYLTFQGMARIARHVITEYIKRQPKVKSEEYDYSLERAGIVQVPLAPQHWVWRADNLTASSGRKRLEGLLDEVALFLQTPSNGKITDLREMLLKVEGMLPQISFIQRRPFLAIYFIFNFILNEQNEKRMENYSQIQKRFGNEIMGPSVESMLTHLVTWIVPDWSLEEHRRVHNDYFRDQRKRSGLKVSCILESGLSLDLAERYRARGETDTARILLSNAVENHPGHAGLLNLERNFDPNEPIKWQDVVLPKEKSADSRIL